MTTTARRLHYKEIPTLREVLIASHREPHLTLHRREDRGWISIEAGNGQTIALQSVAARLLVDDVYTDGLEDAGR